jgi:DNA-binding NarL/FixJ family response regulator
MRCMTPDPSAHFSKRETEVLDLLSEGLGNKEIASRLGLSTETVRAYLKTAYEKLKVHSRLEAALKYRPRRNGSD